MDTVPLRVMFYLFDFIEDKNLLNLANTCKSFKNIHEKYLCELITRGEEYLYYNNRLLAVKKLYGGLNVTEETIKEYVEQNRLGIILLIDEKIEIGNKISQKINRAFSPLLEQMVYHYDMTAFKAAVMTDNVKIAKIIMSRGSAFLGNILTTEAFESGHTNVIKYIVTHNSTDFCAEQVYENACRYGHFDIAKLLISRIPVWNESMRYACEYGNIEFVELLISLGVKCSRVNIFTAFEGNHFELVKLLLKKLNY